jgi:hypothetical protein
MVIRRGPDAGVRDQGADDAAQGPDQAGESGCSLARWCKHPLDWEVVELALASSNDIEHLSLTYDAATRRLFGVPGPDQHVGGVEPAMACDGGDELHVGVAVGSGPGRSRDHETDRDGGTAQGTER